jgi:hypothetical protein
MRWNKRKEVIKQNELRIAEVINELNKKTYAIEKYRMWGKHSSMWFTEKSGIGTYANAVKIKAELEQEILRDTIDQTYKYYIL